MNVADFFIGDQINLKALPAFRPDIAVLLQPDLFNTKTEEIFGETNIPQNEKWTAQTTELLEIRKNIEQGTFDRW